MITARNASSSPAAGDDESALASTGVSVRMANPLANPGENRSSAPPQRAQANPERADQTRARPELRQPSGERELVGERQDDRAHRPTLAAARGQASLAREAPPVPPSFKTSFSPSRLPSALTRCSLSGTYAPPAEVCKVSEKLDRKELRQPDEFQVVAGKAMEYLVSRRQLLIGALAVVVAAALIGWGVTAYMGSRESKAGVGLSEALELQARPIAGDPGLAPGAETFPSKDERTKAVQAALEKVRSDYSSSQAARTAGAELGFLRLKAGDAAGASQLLSAYVEQGRKDDPLRAVALEALGVALENQGKLDEAKAVYGKLAEAGAPERGAFQQARVLLAQGKSEALADLEKVAKDYPKDSVATDAQRRLELASLPPAPPAGSSPAALPQAPQAPQAPTKAKPALVKGKPSPSAKPTAKPKG